MENCYIFNTKLSAWFGSNSVYTSDMTQAKTFGLDEAIKFCKTRLDICVPVRVEDMLKVRAK